MRQLLSCLLLFFAGATNAQFETQNPLPFPEQDVDLLQGGPAWLVGDHVKARKHFMAASERGHPLGQYNLAMMLLYREGGPCDSSKAITLLHEAAGAGVVLAGEALAQMQSRGSAAQYGLRRPFPCPLPNPARSVPAVRSTMPAATR
ncbi:MAG: hypothetical protein ABI434_23320 [Burkholderiaceae bacterium]